MLTKRRRYWLSLLIVVTAPAATFACLWDYDTLRDERRGLPGIAEVLAGKWERHSQFFYEKRIEKMKALVEREPNNLAAYDNLAVAFEKLNDQDAAIEVMLAKEELKPGEYTTHANLGTFYVHKGDLEKGALHIRRALEINPAAHFGREEYQLKLIEFALAGRENPKLLTQSNFLGLRADGPMRPATLPSSRPSSHFSSTAPSIATEMPRGFHAERGSPSEFAAIGLKENVFDGLVGIIRFGTGTSAELYVTLGDLLALRGDKNLAYRAYQRARDLSHPRDEYLRDVMSALEETIHDKADIAPAKIAAERASAEAWVRGFQDYEDDLLRRGIDTDDERNYLAFYARYGSRDEPVNASLAERLLPRDPALKSIVIALGIATVLLLVAAISVYRLIRRRARRMRSAARG